MAEACISGSAAERARRRYQPIYEDMVLVYVTRACGVDSIRASPALYCEMVRMNHVCELFMNMAVWRLKEEITDGYVWQFLLDMGVPTMKIGDVVYTVREMAIAYSEEAWFEFGDGEKPDHWTPWLHGVYRARTRSFVARAAEPAYVNTSQQTERLFATVLLGIYRLEDTGVLEPAHTLLLEDILKCWTVADNAEASNHF